MADRETQQTQAQHTRDIVEAIDRQATAMERIADVLEWMKTKIVAEDANTKQGG